MYERARSNQSKMIHYRSSRHVVPPRLLLNQERILHQIVIRSTIKPSNHIDKQWHHSQTPNETAHQHLHTGTYFGECIGLSCRANSPATVDLLLLRVLTLSSSTSSSSSSSRRRDQLWPAVSLLIPSQPCGTGRDTSSIPEQQSTQSTNQTRQVTKDPHLKSQP